MDNYTDLQIVKELVYDKCGLVMTDLKLHAESSDYGACSFKLNEQVIEHRVSKITPVKTGQFVTVWKRNDKGITIPFDMLDNINFIVITVRNGDNFGQFIFPKPVLADKRIISQNGKGGKRGIRVYPPWDIAASKQAKKTQDWQIDYFLLIKSNNSINFDLANKLFDK